jgi:hypothetical protein
MAVDPINQMYLARSAVNQSQANFCKAPPPIYTPCPLRLLELGAKSVFWGRDIYELYKATKLVSPSWKILTNPIARGVFSKSYGVISKADIKWGVAGLALNGVIGAGKEAYANWKGYSTKQITTRQYAAKIGVGALKGAAPSVIGAGVGAVIGGVAGVFLGGVGAVPGAVIGAKIGATIGDIAGEFSVVKNLSDKLVDKGLAFVGKHKQVLAGAAIGVLGLPAAPLAAGFILGSWFTKKFLK